MTDPTPTVTAWLILSGMEADLERLAALPRYAIDQAQLARVEAAIWQLRKMEKAA